MKKYIWNPTGLKGNELFFFTYSILRINNHFCWKEEGKLNFFAIPKYYGKIFDKFI